MFKIKICGVKLKQDVDAVARAGADAIGLNFFNRSIRYLDPHQDSTRRLSAHAHIAGIKRIGVFVNLKAAEIDGIAEQVGLDAVQLHGDESTSVAAELIENGWSVIRAIKLPVENLTADLIDRCCGPWIDLGCHLLLDADAGARHGGSGRCLDWHVVGTWAQSRPATGWTLAGGLDASNVSLAILRSHASSVDTASGAEEPRGIKSAIRIENFVQASRRALELGTGS